MRAQVQAVDAVKATKWLEQIHVQRSVSDRVVEKYAADMKAGKWRLTGQPIIFDSENHLIDGQHRLWAVVQSRTEVPMLVVYGVDPDAIHSIDVGRSRPIGTVLALLGVQNANRTVAVVRQIAYAVNNEDRAMSVDQVQAFIEDYPGVLWIMSQPHISAAGVLSTAPILAAFAIAFQKSPKLTQEAWEAFRSGADLAKGDPLLTMRNVLAGPQGKVLCSTTSGRRSLVRRMLTALAYKQAGKSLQRSYDSTEGIKVYLGARASSRAEKTLSVEPASAERTVSVRSAARETKEVKP